MAEKRRQYTEECKREAIRLDTEQGYGVSETARNLGINAHMWDAGNASLIRKAAQRFPVMAEWPQIRKSCSGCATKISGCAWSVTF